MDLNHIIVSRGKKMIDICCVGSRVTYHSLCYRSIVMMSLVEFLTGECRAKRYERSFKWHNQPEKKIKDF